MHLAVGTSWLEPLAVGVTYQQYTATRSHRTRPLVVTRFVTRQGGVRIHTRTPSSACYTFAPSAPRWASTPVASSFSSLLLRECSGLR